MHQQNNGGRIADDFPAIAARMRELSSHSGQVSIWSECGACDSKGWLWSLTALDWRRCPRCDLSRYHPKPGSRR